MGSFAGHALPGAFFIVFGVWWLIHILRRYFHSRNNNSAFVCSATFSIKGFPVEPLLKMFFVSVGMIIEIGISGNLQHSTMYIFFGLTGIIDLLIFFQFHLPKDLDYISLCLAVIMEAILFKFHLFGRNALNVLLHQLLLYILVGTIIAVTVEMKYKNSIQAALLRPYFSILQGTWFYQVGFILYKPVFGRWDPEDHHSLKTAALAFTWHCGTVFVFILLMFLLCSRIYRQKNPKTCNYMELLNNEDTSDRDV